MPRLAAILILFLPLSVMAESVYVVDQLSIGIFSGPNDQPPEVKRASSGDLLEVLERAEGAIKVQDAAGVEGWVKVGLVSSAKPARVQLSAARADAERLKLELNATKAQLQSLNGRLKQAEDNLSNEKNRASVLTSEMTETKAKEQAATKQAAKAMNSTPIISNEIAYGVWILISVGMLVGGFIVGYSYVREKYRRKL
jgi:SH3 domain protein